MNPSNNNVCPFCLEEYDDTYNLVVEKVVIDNVFVHYDKSTGSLVRFCPFLNSPDINSVCIDIRDKVVELEFDRKKKD